MVAKKSQEDNRLPNDVLSLNLQGRTGLVKHAVYVDMHNHNNTGPTHMFHVSENNPVSRVGPLISHLFPTKRASANNQISTDKLGIVLLTHGPSPWSNADLHLAHRVTQHLLPG